MIPVLISVDTEAHVGRNPVETMIFGKTDTNGACGITLLMDMFDEVGAKALFFVDFAEAWDYGEDKLKSIVDTIRNRNHDVGVHIHPDHMLDRERKCLWQYTYYEQFDMIQRVTDLFTRMVGERPIAFRAGRYGINSETLDILNHLGYLYDFSQFYGNKSCGIDPPLTCNKVVRYQDGLYEIPVTAFKSFSSNVYNRWDKIDASMELGEYKRIMRVIVKGSTVDIVSLFVHSFSLLNWRARPDHPLFSASAKRNLDAMLQYVASSPDFTYVALNDLSGVIDTLSESRRNVSDIGLLNCGNGLAACRYLLIRAAKVFISRMQANANI